MRETRRRFGRWRCSRCLVSVEGGGRLRFCCSSRWRSLVWWSHCGHGPACRVGWGDGKQCLLPFLAAPLSASLNSPSCSCRALQQVTCINDASRLGSGERPMWVPMRARDPVPWLPGIPECSSGPFWPCSSSCHDYLPFAMSNPANFRTRHRATDLHQRLTGFWVTDGLNPITSLSFLSWWLCFSDGNLAARYIPLWVFRYILTKKLHIQIAQKSPDETILMQFWSFALYCSLGAIRGEKMNSLLSLSLFRF